MGTKRTSFLSGGTGKLKTKMIKNIQFKPVLVMRDTTERPEAVTAGTVQLVGANKDNIIKGVQDLIDDKDLYLQMSKAHNPYGEGKAVEEIINFVNNI